MTSSLAVLTKRKEPIIYIGTEPVYTRNECIYRCVRLLANVCDGAHDLDGIGFNRLHANYGHYLAEKAFDDWSQRDLYRAWRMLKTYKNTQLAEYWPLIPPHIDNPDELTMREIPAPLRPGQRREPAVVEHTDRVIDVVNFAVDREAVRRVGTDNPFVIQLRQNWHGSLIDAIRQIPDRVYDPNNKRWLVPVTVESTDALTTLIEEWDYTIAEGVGELIESALKRHTEIVALSYESDAAFDIKPLPEGLTLKPFQLAGVRYAVQQGNIIFGDQMGLGKTVEALATVHHKEMFPVVIVCPATIKDKWARECNKWLPGKRVVVLRSRQAVDLVDSKGRPCYDVVILNYDILRNWSADIGIMEPACFICDEAHKMKNPNAKRTKQMKLLFDLTPTAQRLFLTGTALVNRVMELGTLLVLLGKIDKFGGIEAFERRYDTDWSERRRELGDRLRAFAMIRRLKKDVLPELEDKQYDIVPLEIDNRDEYIEWEFNLATFMAEKKAALIPFSKGAAIQEALELGIEDAEAVKQYVRDKELEVRGEVFDKHYAVVEQRQALLRWEQLKQIAVKGKKRAVYDWLDEFLADGDEKIVVFGTHTEFIHELAAKYGCEYIDGSVKTERRQEIADRFQSDETVRMIVGNINAMGEGLDLFAASHVAFVELGWSPKDMLQAEDRLHRIGQKDSVMVHYLVAENTIEDEIAAIIEKKVQLSDDVLEGNGKDHQFDIVKQLTARLEERVAKQRR